MMVKKLMVIVFLMFIMTACSSDKADQKQVDSAVVNHTRVQITYADPDYEKAFPVNLSETIDQIFIKMRRDFKGVVHEDEAIPGSLILLLEKALYDGEPHSPKLKSPSFEIDKEVFFQKFYSDFDPDDKEMFDRHVCPVYQYKLDNQTYYLVVTGSGGTANFVEITIYKGSGNELEAVDDLLSLDFNARVIEYEQELYLIDAVYNYYSKFEDTVHIYKLVPGKLENYVSIFMEPIEFHWETVFRKQNPYEKAVNEYIDGLKEDLMAKSIIDDQHLEVYIGDEKEILDEDKYLRLKSVGGEYDYHTIDFNNDGQEEYVSRHFWYPSNFTNLHLIDSFYKFTDDRIIEMGTDYTENYGMPLQLWFKEIEGKVFTFRLFYSANHYVLNVSLIQGTNIDQMLTHIIVPKEETFRVYSNKIITD